MAKDALALLQEKRGASGENSEKELEKIIGKAADETLEETPAQEEEEPLEEEDPTTSEEDDDEEELEEEDGLTADQIKEARNLYKALSSTATATPIIQALASQMGLKIGSESTKAEKKEAEKDITEALKEALGEFGFLAEKMGPVIKNALENERAKSQEIEQRLEVKQIQGEVENALSRLAKETKGESRKFESQMISLMDRFHPAPNQKTEDYIREVFETVTRGKVKLQAVQAVADKINRNRKDVQSRISSNGSGVQNSSTVLPPEGKKLGLKGAVQFAYEQQMKQNALPKSTRR